MSIEHKIKIKCNECEKFIETNDININEILSENNWITEYYDDHELHFCSDECRNKAVDTHNLLWNFEILRNRDLGMDY